jgi:hypothetical protein
MTHAARPSVHSHIVVFTTISRPAPPGIFPVAVLNSVKAVPEVCRVYCATANPVSVVVAKLGDDKKVGHHLILQNCRRLTWALLTAPHPHPHPHPARASWALLTGCAPSIMRPPATRRSGTTF